MSLESGTVHFKAHKHIPLDVLANRIFRDGNWKVRSRIIEIAQCLGVSRYKRTIHAVWQAHILICERTGFPPIQGKFSRLKDSGDLDSQFFHWLNRFEVALRNKTISNGGSIPC